MHPFQRHILLLFATIFIFVVASKPARCEKPTPPPKPVVLTKEEMKGLKIYDWDKECACDGSSSIPTYIAKVQLANHSKFVIRSVTVDFQIWTASDPEFPPEISFPFTVKAEIQPMLIAVLTSKRLKPGVKDDDDIYKFTMKLVSATGTPVPAGAVSSPSAQLDIAAAVGDMATLQRIAKSNPELIAKGISPSGDVYLSLAARVGSMAEVSFLLDHGAPIDQHQATFDNATPLITALYARQTEVIRLLMQRRANVNAPDVSGRTAIDVAKLLWQTTEPNDVELADLQVVSDPRYGRGVVGGQ